MGNISAVGRQLEAMGFSVRYNEKMCGYTSFKIGGAADLLLEVGSAADLSRAVRLLRENEVKTTILGNGSNILVSDEGIRGAVLRLTGEFSSIRTEGTRIVCGAGVLLSKLCRTAAESGLSGLEFAYGIPGSVGGAIYMNAGAYGGEMKDAVASCEYMDESGQLLSISVADMDMSYRHSFFGGKNLIICSASFDFCSGDREEILSKMKEIMQRRVDKQPLEMPSAGSVFKRPEGYFAGALIEQCGLKGCSVGGAQVSVKHSGFIVNTGGATCKDVLELVRHIQQTVQRETGVLLECEIKVIS
ncbi:MAG: UDP-N-acetylmuramate dehydrogenase [Oscillospiraceae bacterium]|jgi:UDP-N-acetylmuramate dehydrogenase|nr:UDP-N-acetylmuramate dehydrogenase [Oscillospiraceae bacterium]